MMRVWNELMELLLKDEEWHTTKEIQQKLGLSESKMKLLIDFLVSYDFCSYSPTAVGIRAITKIKLKPAVRRFFEALDAIETKN